MGVVITVLVRFWRWLTLNPHEEIRRLLRLHGESYGLDLVRESAGSLGRGSIYVHLHRMEENGEVESRVGPHEHDIELPRRLYRLVGFPKRT